MSTLLYNPDRKTKEELINEFVVRTEIYEAIMRDLQSSPMKHPEQHYLIVGQRGTGKTTLLNRIKYGIEDDERISKWLIPIAFTEEQYFINELLNLWESIAEQLEDYYGFEDITKEIASITHKTNREELGFEILEKHLKKNKKKIILLLDNLGDMLKKLDKKEIHRFREILQTKSFIRLIAGSPFYLEETIDYHQPFYEFFKIIRIDSLSIDETQKLLRKLAEMSNHKEKIGRIIKETPERIEVLRTLTGGVPRTIVLMFNIFIESDDQNSVKDLEQILDAVTPLYKHRMDDLPAQQQKIMHAVAISWDAISVKDLKDKVRLESKVVSAQLKQLEKNQVIEKIETSTKNNLYLLKERFFNIWYLMRYGRKDDKQRVVWLVRFLESWCSAEDIKIRIHAYVNKLNKKELNEKTAELFGHVYSTITNLDIEDRVLLKIESPEKVASGIKVTDEELNREIKRYKIKKDWRKILQLSRQLNVLSRENKIDVYEACVNGLPIKNIFDGLIDEKTGSLPLEKANPGDIEILIGWTYLMLMYYMDENNIDKVKAIFPAYHDILQVERNKETGVSDMFFTSLVTYMLAKKQVNLAAYFFGDEFTFKERFKSLYYAIIYLKDGPTSTEYLKAGPELQESIQGILKVVKGMNE